MITWPSQSTVDCDKRSQKNPSDLLDCYVIAWPEGQCNVRQLIEVIGLNNLEDRVRACG